jgi:hypothetical protein
MKRFRNVVAWLLGAALLMIGIVAANRVQYGARLLGVHEVPPVVTTASGTVRIGQSFGIGAMRYRIEVHNIPTVTVAHIHCAPIGVNGPIGVTLYAGPPVNVDGLLVSGSFSAPDPGNSCGWTSLDDVANAIVNGNAYVNVHTTAHPPGEIRGQLQVGP